jgi:uncharacterized protein YbjT (DUF2867 family)
VAAVIALVMGATGLVGRELVQQLALDARFEKVVTFGRRAGKVRAAKLDERIVDLDRPETFADKVRGDVAFSCLGTTKSAAGGVEAQRVVDVQYPLTFARNAAAHGVATFALVSSAGADATSRFAYPQMKGELDEAVAALSFPRVRILRPSLLVGNREQARLGERVGAVLGKALANVGIARSYRPIAASTVARALVASAFDGPEARTIYTLDELFPLAERASR